MVDETQNTNGFNASSEAKRPEGSATDRIKDYGKKATQPLIDLLQKYQGDITPLIGSINTGIQGAISALETESASESDRQVSVYFRDASTWFSDVQDKFKFQSTDEFMSFLEEEGRKHPAMIFAVSYIVGLVLGRAGRHVGSIAKQELH